MLINELEEGTIINITVGIQGSDKTLSLNSEVYSDYKHQVPAVIVPAFRYQNKLLNFKNCKIKVEAIVDGRPLMFKLEHIGSIIIDDIVYNVIFSKTDAKPINRRGAMRYQMVGDAVVRVGKNSRTYLCHTHDISATGISFMVYEDINVNNDDNLYISFESQGLRCAVEGTVKRIEKVSDNKTIVGCELKGNSSLVEQIVGILMRKQAGKNKDFPNSNKR